MSATLRRTPERAAVVERAVAALRRTVPEDLRPQAVFVLGSGLGAWADTLADAVRVPLAGIPGVPAPSVAGHAGLAVFGRKGTLRVAALSGRVHLYEGHAPGDVTLALESVIALGARVVVITNAAGSVNRNFVPGDLMLIVDHINRTDLAPLRDEWVAGEPRLRHIARIYSTRLNELVSTVAMDLSLPLRRGVYHALRGPTYETPAEVRVAATFGADAVGMSTVAESAAAAALGAEVVGISCITNRAAGLSADPLSHAEVMETAERVRSSFLALLDGVAGRLADDVSGSPPVRR